MGRVGGVVVEIFGVCGVGGSFTAPNGPGRPPPSPVDVNDGQSPPRQANGTERGQFLHENDARGCPQATGVPSGPSRGCRAKRWPPGWVATRQDTQKFQNLKIGSWELLKTTLDLGGWEEGAFVFDPTRCVDLPG